MAFTDQRFYTVLHHRRNGRNAGAISSCLSYNLWKSVDQFRVGHLLSSRSTKAIDYFCSNCLKKKKKTEKKQEDRQCGNKPNHWPLAETNAHFLRYSSAKALQKINILIYTEQDQVLRLKAQTTLITGDYSSVTIQDSQMAKLDLLPGRVVLINEQNKELKLKTLSLSLNLPPLLTN